MSDLIVTVEQAAEQLRVHPKTVLRYIHDGRLEATRMGKSYRIPKQALAVLAGIAAGASSDTSARTTCITDLPDMTVEAAERLATFLQSAALTGDSGTPPLHLQTAYDPQARILKVVMIGQPSDVGQLLELMQVHITAKR